MFLLFLDSKQADRRNSPSKVEDISKAKGTRWMGYKQFRVVLQSISDKDQVEIPSKPQNSMGKGHLVQILLWNLPNRLD